MRIPGSTTVRHVARRIHNRLIPGTVVLMYHRIVYFPSDPFRLNVTPQHFAEQLEIIRTLGQPMPLPRLVQALPNRTQRRRTVVITLDDGYADNLIHAVPLLEQYEIPATIFVATGGLIEGREFWWDELERLVLRPGTLPPPYGCVCRDRPKNGT